ncbi:hypothetical protein PSEUBRA_003488 [Kalmanozyma brasiliensis GHG001]|uniref:Heparan-alpha-glucosaminide N-acetyltransferase catalytic domain-containing protein n=1 Tax=Kalmanozyma brasiliensis (strain GHG001) TaxID=1365824 RepID=V5EV29_KALBG|nr:uncharacterized protein PSEUBRA_003488 [Kalmanozyma brasiliensis GHG001]EST07038.1 hypothetical protein PSEUBRA_003488 [Kalmanozyma brasiliensis GHG001]
MSTSSTPAPGAVQVTNFALPPPTASNGYGTIPTHETPTTKPTSTSTRVLAPDLLRGLILPLMSLDHAALFMGAWLHGTPEQSESAGTIFTRWNFNAAYISRTVTHLCAPGFFFLMGMGTVYFHRSRAKLGWGRGRMTRHFVVRALALTAVNEVMGLTLMWGRHFWLINIVLIGLAVDYLLTGLLCLVVDGTERSVAGAIDGMLVKAGKGSDDAARRPLLANGGSAAAEEQRGHSNGNGTTAATPVASARAQTLSFWLHNFVLAVLTYITIFWNVWLSPSGGHCSATSAQPSSFSQSPIELLALAPSSVSTMAEQPPSPPGSRFGPWFDFWFYSVQNKRVMSGFPPLAWISFCIFGMLYARVMLYKRWTPRAVVAWNLGVGVVLAALFVGTRVLHFGNLSEGCLRMPEQLAHPERNQYLVSIKSFFYITKYPPSPAFFFLTMSVNFALLALFSAIPPAVATAIPGLMNFGGSALFFYVAHMYLYFLLAIPARYFFEHDLPDTPPNAWERTKGLGASAPFWITWIAGLFILSPMCRAYGRFKAAQSADSLWRFF